MVLRTVRRVLTRGSHQAENSTVSSFGANFFQNGEKIVECGLRIRRGLSPVIAATFSATNLMINFPGSRTVIVRGVYPPTPLMESWPEASGMTLMPRI